MKPSAKKQRLTEWSPTKELEFLDLNDDCIRHIFWILSPADLCSMSFTCVRMQALTFDHFPRQYPYDRLTIAINVESQSPHFRNNKKWKKYRTYFSKCIQNVRIVSSGTHANVQCLFDFLNVECGRYLRKLELNIDGRLRMTNIEVIQSRLENLSKLTIENPFSRYDIHDILLKHCKRLEHFDISSTTNFDASWMLHEYPTMKSLTIDVYEDEKPLITQFKLFAKKFFQLNPQIKQLQCSGNVVLETVLQNVVNIERLVLNFDCYSHFRDMNGQLEEYSKRSQIKWLEITVHPDDATVEDYKALQNFNVVQPIHSLFIFLNDSSNEVTFLSQLKFVRKLEFSIPYRYRQENELLHVLSKLPHLQDLVMNLHSINLVFKDLAMRFVTHSVEMRNLVFRFCCPATFIFHPFDLFELNRARSSMRCASNIVIRMEYHNHKCFVQPAFIHPASPVINLEFALGAEY